MAHVYQHRVYAPPAVWQDSAEGMVPSNSPVVGGRDINGEPLYIGRAVHDGDTIPGKVVSTHHVCYVAYGGGEHAHHTYQVLTNPRQTELIWVPAEGGRVPTGAIQGGAQADGVKLYIGRGYHNGSMVIGKVHPEHNVLYIPFDGSEISLPSYEALVIKQVHASDY